MPKGSKVEKVYKAVKKKEMQMGMSKDESQMHAAMIAQAKTGKSLKTGKKPRKKS